MFEEASGKRFIIDGIGCVVASPNFTSSVDARQMLSQHHRRRRKRRVLSRWKLFRTLSGSARKDRSNPGGQRGGC